MKNIINEILISINRQPFSVAYTCWRRYISKKEKYKETLYRYGYWYHRDKKSKDPVYFIFRFGLPGTGIGSIANTMHFCYEWAIKKNCIPIIDLEPEVVYKRGDLGVNNIWEYCFEPPMPIKEVLKQKNVYISNLGLYSIDREACYDINGNKKDMNIHLKYDSMYYKKLNKISKNYLKLNASLQEQVNEFIKVHFRDSRVLGVALREEFSLFSDVTRKDKDIAFYVDHPLVPDVEESIEIVKQMMEKWNCNKIFLSTMYEESVCRFQQVFGDKVIFLQRQRKQLRTFKDLAKRVWNNSGDNEFSNNFFNSDEFKEQTVSYIKEVYILSNCQCFIGAPSSIAALCPVISGGDYEHFLFFEDRHHIS